MPFPRLNIKFNKNFGTSPREEFIPDEETGIITTKTVPCNEKLPDAKFFKIENQIKAGITLNEVNTKVITETNPNLINTAINSSIEKEKSKSQSKSKENVNENT